MLLKPPPGSTCAILYHKQCIEPNPWSADKQSCVAAIFACPCRLGTLLWPLQQEVRMRGCVLNIEPILLTVR